VVDDASTDGTWGVLQQYARRDARIRPHRNARNVRQVTSLNLGILEARAPYVAIMDADDIAAPLRLEHQASYLDEHPDVGVVGSLYDAFESDPLVCRPSMARLDGSWRDGNVVMQHATMMVRRDLYAIHGLYDPSYDDAGDYEIQSRFAHGGVRFHVLNEVLLHYRVHPGSMTGRRRRQQEGAALRISTRTLLRYRQPLTARGFVVTARHAAIYVYMSSGLSRVVPASLLKRVWPAR
jgi:glycosyltransferase involved in cell wall biosynthesis